MGFKDEYSKINKAPITSKPTRASQKAAVTNPVQAFSARMAQRAQQNIAQNRANNYQNSINEANNYKKESDYANSWQGMAKNTLKGLIPYQGDTYSKIGNQIVNHPFETAGAIGSGVYKGLDETLGKLQIYSNPAMLIPQFRQAQDEARGKNPILNYKPSTQTGQDIQSGFEMGGQVPAYMAGGEVAGATKLAQVAPRLAQYLGFQGTSQLLSDKKITDVKGRAEQAAIDSLMFALTGGLRKGKVSQKISETELPKQSTIPKSDTADIPSTKGDVRLESPNNTYTPNTLQNGENVNGPTASRFKQELAKLQNERLQSSLATDRPQITGKESVKTRIEKTVGLRDKTPNARALDSKIAQIERKLTAPEKLNIQDQAKYDFQDWKDKGSLSLTRETMERNLEDVAGKDAPAVKNFLVEPVRQNETARTNFVNEIRKDIKSKIIDNYKIKPGSKEDALIQKFGEGRITLDELKQATKKWQQVADASAYFKDKYNTMLDMVNEQRAKFGYEPIPKRADYFRHFQDIGSVIDQLGLITKQDRLPTNIAGLTDIFKPGKPFSTAEMQRKGGKFTESAIGGMDNYLESISKQIFHIDSVQRGRALEQAIRDAAEKNPNINLQNMVSNVNEYTNLLSGKKGIMDRVGERFLGRGTYGVINWLKRRTGANMIGANLASALTNFIPFTQSLATTSKVDALHGMLETMISPLRENFADIGGQTSGFLTRRYPVEKLSQTLTEKSADKAGIMFKWIDQFATKSIVSGKYFENISKGIEPKEAMRLADNYAGKVITDRSWGQLPVLFGQKTLGPLTQFQAEVNNMYSFIKKDIPRQYQGNILKSINALAQFVIYSYLYNNMAENIVGRRPTIDPIQAGLTLFGKTEGSKEQTQGQRIIQASTDIGQNLPFLSILTGGGRLPINAGIPNPFAVASGQSTWGKELAKPAYYLAPPFGGGQLKKTIEGTQAYNEVAIKNLSGNIQVPIEQNLQNRVRTSLFGKYAVPGTAQYFANPHPLSEQQTQLFNQLPNNQALDYFNFLQNDRQANSAQISTHDKMKAMIEQGIKNNDNQILQQAAQLDPGAFKKLLDEVIKKQVENETDPQTRVELEKIKAMRNPFYTK